MSDQDEGTYAERWWDEHEDRIMEERWIQDKEWEARKIRAVKRELEQRVPLRVRRVYGLDREVW